LAKLVVDLSGRKFTLMGEDVFVEETEISERIVYVGMTVQDDPSSNVTWKYFHRIQRSQDY
jgi:hypothetical protein